MKKALFFVPLLVLIASPAYATWYNTSWESCKNITINNTQPNNHVNEILNINLTDIRFNNSYELRLINSSCNDGGEPMTWEIVSNTSGSVEILFNKSTNANTNDTWSIYYNNSNATNGQSDVFTQWDSFKTNTLNNQFKNFSYTTFSFEQNDWIHLTTAGQPANWVNGIYNNTSFPVVPYTLYARMNITNVATDEAGIGLFNTSYSKPRRTSMVINGANYYAFYCTTKGSDCNWDTASISATTNVWYRFKIYFNTETSNQMWIFLDSNNSVLINKNYTSKENITGQGVYFGAQSDGAQNVVDYVGTFTGDVNFYNVSSALALGSEVNYTVTPPTPIPAIIDNTVVCFTTQPVCINLKDSTLIYKGKGYYD